MSKSGALKNQDAMGNGQKRWRRARSSSTIARKVIQKESRPGPMVEFNCAVLSPWWAFFSGRERLLRPLAKASPASSRSKQFGSPMQKSNFTTVFPVWRCWRWAFRRRRCNPATARKPLTLREYDDQRRQTGGGQETRATARTACAHYETRATARTACALDRLPRD